MKIETINSLEKVASDRVKIYYQLNQLSEITTLSPRALKYRMVEMKNKYDNIPSLLVKTGRSWQIHYSILYEFFPKRKRKTTTLYTYPWASLATWNMKSSYDLAYHVELIQQIKTALPSHTFHYCIEQDGRGNKHLHVVSDATSKDLKETIPTVLNTYIQPREYNLNISNINNKYSTVAYLQKSSIASGTL